MLNTEKTSDASLLGERNSHLLPTLVDTIALKDPQALWCEFPYSPSNYEDGYRRITYKELSNAVNGTAYWLENTLGRGHNFETLAYIGPNDPRYPIFVLGAVKAGYKILLTSPRNSIAAHINLFTLLDCETLITSTPALPVVEEICNCGSIKLFQAPSLKSLLEEQFPRYPYDRSFEDAANDPLAVLHTSGSTGFPKPITIPLLFATVFANMTQLSPPPGLKSQLKFLHGTRLFCTLPQFHAVGLYFGLISPVFNGTTFIFPLPGTIPTGEGLVQALKHTMVEAAFLAPSVVEDISEDEVTLNQVAASLKTIIYSGGDLPQKVGDLVAARIRLFPIYGTTEISHGPQLTALDDSLVRKDWKYLHWNESAWGADFREHSADLYELNVVRTSESIKYQTAFTIFPEREEFSTGDLFTPHPTKPNLWAYRGRSDDLIVFLNGEKVNPTQAEERIASHPEVRAAIMAGAQKAQPALLVELKDSHLISLNNGTPLLDNIWPVVEQANQENPSYARVSREMVLFTDSEKPPLRTAKGTVIRKASLELYAKELEDLFQEAESESSRFNVSFIKSINAAEDVDAVERIICQLVCSITGWQSLDAMSDFFLHGMDSLQALQLSRSLREPFGISLKMVYNNSSAASLTQIVQQRPSCDQLVENNSESRQKEIDDTLIRYTNQIRFSEVCDLDHTSTYRKNALLARSDTGTPILHTVVLTGSSGTLGSHILRRLLVDPLVSHIYCLDRPSKSRTPKLVRKRSYDSSNMQSSDKVTFLVSDLARSSRLGLEEPTYESLCSTTTLIIHNAWSVDFNRNLKFFDSQLKGVVNLANFAASAEKSPAFLFVSSIASVQNYSASAYIPESIVSDHTAPASMGYAESKHVAECLLDHAARVLGLKIGIARVGQIIGPAGTSGNWKKNEWLPSMVISSKHLGAIPESLRSTDIRKSQQELNWVPIDILADVLIQLIYSIDQSAGNKGHGLRDSGALVFHPLNPHTQEWSNLLPTMVETLDSIQNAKKGTSEPVRQIPLSEWIELLERSALAAKNDEEVKELSQINPAIKLIDFYRGLITNSITASFETNKAIEASPALQSMGSVREESLVKWIKEWLSASE